MSKRMLIDASHPEETRVVVIDGNRVEEFDFEAAARRPLKGNIYLAKVTRVEPSLQAAFVEYGGNRQGFLAFSEIHPDYYQIPVADRMAILQAQTERMMAEEDIEAIDSRHRDEAAPHTDESDTNQHAEDNVPETSEGEEFNHLTSGEAGAERIESGLGAIADENGFALTRADAAEQSDASHGNGGAAASVEDPTTPDTERSDDPIAEEPASGLAATDTGPAITESSGDASEEPTASENLQAESTGAPQTYQRRETRHDRPRQRRRQYKIQEVIKRRQVMLVQVVKEERGNKGASLTTFLSLAGRYCVLMPNTPRGGGISRKITNAADRKRLKGAAQSLDLPEGMGLIIRTAGANRTKTEIKRDYEYLLRLWDTVRELTLKSNAPALVYEEGSLIKRAIRDLYTKEISEVLVDGEPGYRDAKEFMRMLMPSHAKNVKLYREPLPLFQRLQVESQLDAMFSPVVHLRSGGYIVINQTEALVSIDVNSGRATREHSIEETALKTNLEASDEIARQLRLRDLAGLIVIDFIDMEDSKNDRNVEKRLHNAVRNDRARIQIGRISQFGLLELSRQRLRAGVIAGSTITCPHCNGQGIIRSTESAALRLLRALDEEGQRQPSVNLTVRTPSDVAIYTLNQKRREMARIEEAYDVGILFEPQANMASGSFEIQRTGMRVPSARPKISAISVEAGFRDAEAAEIEPDITIVEPPELPVAVEPAAAQEPAQADGRGRKRRRRRRGGRGRNGRPMPGEQEVGASEQSAESFEHVPQSDADEEVEKSAAQPDISGQPAEGGSTAPVAEQGESGERRRRRRRRGRRGRQFETELQAPTQLPRGDGFAAEPDTGLSASIATPAGHESLFRSEALPEARPDVMPNTPSSPVWSLVDQQVQMAVPASQQVQTDDPAAETPAIEPETTGVEIAAAGQQSAAVHEMRDVTESPSREARKGWWQRRFKG